LPGGGEVTRRYRVFRRALPALCRSLRLDRESLTFTDYTNLISFWLQEESRLSRRRPPARARYRLGRAREALPDAMDDRRQGIED
jgi:hypothetical protein